MRVVIHADASPAIGTGHVTRCLALAAELRREGAEVVLASVQMIDSLAARAAAIGVSTMHRGAAPRDPAWVVVDGYEFDATARSALAEPSVPRLVIDDLGGDLRETAMVVNQNLYATPTGPSRPDPTAELLAGPSYALLGPEFSSATRARAQPPVANRILVTMGGADPGNATAAVIDSLAILPARPQVRVVIGSSHPSAADVELMARDIGFEAVRDASSLAPHLAWADMVVTACGTSVLEVARFGRPMIGVVLADNQERVAAAVRHEGLGVIAGRHPGLDEKKLAHDIGAMRADRAGRVHAAAHGPRIVDGRGAARVARAMRTGPLHLRRATRDDAALLLAWRMDPVARRASFDTDRIDPGAHAAWLDEQLRSPASRLWIGLLDNLPVGVVRFSLAGSSATISVTLAADRRAAGIGSRLVSLGCRQLAAEGVQTIDAWIRRGNEASEAAFRRAGFQLTRDDQADRRRYRLSLAAMG